MKELDFTGFYGNEGLKSYLKTALKANKISHAYIIEGPYGTGKHFLVKHLLKALACKEDRVPCGKCPDCRKIADGNSIDVHTVRAEDGKKSIGVEAIRQIEGLTELIPNDLDFHAVVIEGAELMTPQAQNAFLKMLEEPETAIYFFLITERADALLTTVRSRALTLRTEGLSRAELTELLKNKFAMKDKDIEEILPLANGSAGEALRLKEDKNGEAFVIDRTAREILSDLFFSSGNKYNFTLSMLDKVRSFEELQKISHRLLFAVRDMTNIRHSEKPELTFFDSIEQAEEYTYSVTDAALCRAYSVLIEICDRKDSPFMLSPLLTASASRLYDSIHG